MAGFIPRTHDVLFYKFLYRVHMTYFLRITYNIMLIEKLFWSILLHYIIRIIFIVFSIYSVDEGDLQRDEVAISKVIVKNIYISILV